MALVAPADTRAAVDLRSEAASATSGACSSGSACSPRCSSPWPSWCVLLSTMLVDAWPTLSERGLDFVKSDTSSLASRAGVWQGWSVR